jgi:hypothetical protein
MPHLILRNKNSKNCCISDSLVNDVGRYACISRTHSSNPYSVHSGIFLITVSLSAAGVSLKSDDEAGLTHSLLENHSIPLNTLELSYPKVSSTYRFQNRFLFDRLLNGRFLLLLRLLRSWSPHHNMLTVNAFLVLVETSATGRFFLIAFLP